MVAQTVPFKTEQADHNHNGTDSKCPVFRMLPKKLRREAKEKPHLWEYLHGLPLEKIGVPEYHETLDRSMGDWKSPNLIYPVGNGMFIHILPDPRDARNFYIAIEPGMGQDLSSQLDEVETRLVDYVGDLESSEEDGAKRTQLLLTSLDKVCTVRKSAGKAPKKRKKGGAKDSDGKGKVVLSPQEMTTLRYLMVRDKEGMGPLDPLIPNPPKDTDGRREESGRGVRELQGK